MSRKHSPFVTFDAGHARDVATRTVPRYHSRFIGVQLVRVNEYGDILHVQGDGLVSGDPSGLASFEIVSPEGIAAFCTKHADAFKHGAPGGGTLLLLPIYEGDIEGVSIV